MVGLKNEAIRSKAILNYNFPNNHWTKLSKNLFKTNMNLIKKK